MSYEENLKKKAPEKLTWNFSRDGDQLTVVLKGQLDTLTTPKLERALETEMTGVKSLTLDMEELDYISSSGLRLMLVLAQMMDGEHAVTVRHVNDNVLSTFEMTGFLQMFDLEQE